MSTVNDTSDMPNAFVRTQHPCILHGSSIHKDGGSILPLSMASIESMCALIGSTDSIKIMYSLREKIIARCKATVRVWGMVGLSVCSATRSSEIRGALDQLSAEKVDF